MAAIKNSHPTMLAFLNAYTQGISGGDRQFINFFLNSSLTPTIVTSHLGQQLCFQNGLKADYLITSTEKEFLNPILTYFIRTLHAIYLTIRLRPDYLHSSSDFLPDVLPCFIIKILNPKAFWTQKIYHIIPSNRTVSSFFQKISFLLIRHADLIEVDNPHLSGALISDFNFPSSLVVTLPLLIDHCAITKQTPNSSHYSVIYFGQLRHSKGIFDLAAIWPKVNTKYPQASLAFIGADINSNLSKLQKMKLPPNTVSFLGSLPAHQAWSYIKSSTMVVIPSYEEGYGLAVRESLACQKPVLVYDLPAFSDIKDKNLIRLPLGNINALYLAIIKLLKHYEFKTTG